MKTLVDIDETLLKEAMKVSNASTKKETIHRALAEYIRTCRRQTLKDLAGNGMIEMSLKELRHARRRRQK